MQQPNDSFVESLTTRMFLREQNHRSIPSTENQPVLPIKSARTLHLPNLFTRTCSADMHGARAIQFHRYRTIYVDP